MPEKKRRPRHHLTIKRVGRHWLLLSGKKQLGQHPTYDSALAQMRAIIIHAEG